MWKILPYRKILVNKSRKNDRVWGKKHHFAYPNERMDPGNNDQGMLKLYGVRLLGNFG